MSVLAPSASNAVLLDRLLFAAASCLKDRALGKRLLGTRNLQLLPAPGRLAQAAAEVAARAAVATLQPLQSAGAEELQVPSASKC